MINLPLLNYLDVREYGLFPGDDPATPRMHVRFEPGLTLVLGANGLGKTTLVTMLYRLITGPYEIPALMKEADLGTASLKVVRLTKDKRQTFAHRVADNAAGATARLVFHIGSEQVSVERNLKDLTLRSFTVDSALPSHDEQKYQEEMVRLANVSTFGDLILLLRYIVFCFEDRRSLVWDPSAQRQLLRIFYLEPPLAQIWTEREREILEIDTRVRNMRAVATGEERSLALEQSLANNEPSINEELAELVLSQGTATESLNVINSELSDIEFRYEKARLRFLTLEQER